MNDSLDRRIAQLESELAGLRRQKLADLQSQMLALQTSLGGINEVSRGSSRSEGKPKGRRGRPPKSVKGWAASLSGAGNVPSATLRKKRGGKRGKRIGDAEAIEALKKVVSGSGKEGVSAKHTSEASGISYPRAIKLMDANFKKSGSGKWTRYRA